MIDITSPTSADDLSGEESQLYDLIMDYRAENGLPSIPLSSALTATAGRHALDTLYNIWDAGVTLPPGANLHSWSDAPYYGDHRAPEVMWDAPDRIGIDYPSAGFEISAGGYSDGAEALEGWKTSPGHNSVILNLDGWANSDWSAIGIGIENDSSVSTFGGNIYHVWFGTSVDPAGTPGAVTITVADLATGDPADLFTKLSDFDGNEFGNPGDWKQIGVVDVQNDGDDEYVYVNPTLGRWATLGPDSSDTIDFSDHGQGGDTRVVGVYLDPLVESGQVVKGSAVDSARRFENDLRIDNLELMGAGDYDGDGLQQVYFKTADGTAYLHALMHADGNIRYANYQSEAQMTDYLDGLGFGTGTYEDWLIA